MIASQMKNMKIIPIILAAALLFMPVGEVRLAIRAFAQTPAQDLLRQGIRQYERAEFELAIVTLEQAIAGLEKDDDLVNAYKHLAFSYSALGQEDKAKDAYLTLLELVPEFTLSLTESPTLRRPFEIANAEFEARDREPPVIVCNLPAEVDENTGIAITAEIDDQSMLESAEMYYRKGSNVIYEKVNLIREFGNTYAAFISPQYVTIDGIHLYIRVKDSAGNEPAFFGTPEEPQIITVRMVDLDSPVISHEPILTIQELTPLTITAKIVDRSGVRTATLFFRKSGDIAYNEIPMERQPDDEFTAEILSDQVTEAGVDYYIRAEDEAGNPPAIQGSFSEPLKVTVQIVDIDPPAIEHEPIATALDSRPITVLTTVTDRSGLESVTLHYRKTKTKDFTTVEMRPTGRYQYTAEIPGIAVTMDGIEYYIRANDTAGNKASYAGSARRPFEVTVSRFDTEPPKLGHVAVDNVVEGEKITFRTVVIDNVGVAEVMFHFREKGKSDYNTKQMETKGSDMYEVELEPPTEGMEYYIVARDVSNNEPAFWQSAAEPHVVNVKTQEELAAEQGITPEMLKKGPSKWLFISLGAVVLGGSATAALLLGGKKESSGPPALPGPPSSPDR